MEEEQTEQVNEKNREWIYKVARIPLNKGVLCNNMLHLTSSARVRAEGCRLLPETPLVSRTGHFAEAVPQNPSRDGGWSGLSAGEEMWSAL